MSLRRHALPNDDHHSSQLDQLRSTFGSAEHASRPSLHSNVRQRRDVDQRDLQYFHASAEVRRTRRLTNVFSSTSSYFSPLLISEFTRTLLEHFIHQVECPESLGTTVAARDESGSFFKLGQTVASSSRSPRQPFDRLAFQAVCGP